MKDKKMICSILCVMTLVFLLSFSNVNALQTEKTLGDIQSELQDYLEKNHPNIKVGTEEYMEYLSEQLMTEADAKLATRTDYEDICTYTAKYLSLVEDKQCIYTDEEEILNLSEKEKKMTLQEIEDQSAVQDAEEERLIEKYEAQSSVQPSSSSYSATKAVAYARKWAESRNSTYKSYSKDCTNYVSQCVYAGGISMRKPSTIKHGTTSTTSYWFSKKHKFTGTTGRVTYEYDITTSWMRVSDFFKYAGSHGAKIISCSTLSKLQNQAKPGDIVQLKKSGSWHHSIIITGGSKGSRTYCGHSKNRKDEPVKSLKKEEDFRIIRFN